MRAQAVLGVQAIATAALCFVIVGTCVSLTEFRLASEVPRDEEHCSTVAAGDCLPGHQLS